MVQSFVRVTICVMVFLAPGGGLTTGASAVTLSYEYSGTGNLSFQSDTTLNIGGTCSSPCVISALMSIEGTGPAFNPSIPSGWATGASATVTDNLGDILSLAVNNGNFTSGTKHETFFGFFRPSGLPSTLDISTLSFASILDGAGTISYSLDISLPSGAYVTPLPAALPLFAIALGALGLLQWRRKRKSARLAGD